jgi:UV DNA damage repair endonuclease
MILNFGRNRLLPLDKSSLNFMPEITAAQMEALDVVQNVAEKHQLRLTMQPGDITFINNFALVHAREAFEDSASNIRHLVRLWLKNDRLAWKLPPTLCRGNEHTFEKSGQNWNFMSEPRLSFKLKERFTP